MFNLSNTIQRYDDISYPNRPTKYNEFISDKNNIVHKQLYTDALDKLILYLITSENLTVTNKDGESELMSVDYFKKTRKIIEIKPIEFWSNAYVVVITKKPPYKKQVYSLAPFWNWYQAKFSKSIKTLKVSEDNVRDWEIVKLNYVKGIATLRSRITDETFDVDFDYLDESIPLSDDLTLRNTFAGKINNLI